MSVTAQTPSKTTGAPSADNNKVELQLATIKGFKSKHDDQIDTISMLAELNTWKPSEVSVEYDEDTEAIPGTSIWGSDDVKVNDNSYFV